MEQERPRTYAAIDLKSFYASVECVERGLDPMTHHLVVADDRRTSKTICLAVSPALKAYGVPGRARLFEVEEAVRAVNARRRQAAPGHRLIGSSHSAEELAANPSLALDYVVARPRMSHYMRFSTGIYDIYLRHVAPEDLFAYSVDEVFMELTPYLKNGGRSPRAMVREMIREVYAATGITATAGIGSNLYLCKIAMDMMAKREEPDAEGVRIAELDELSYRRQLWTHRPLTDFWRLGSGYAKKLEEHGIYTMGDVARCSLGGPGDFYNEELLYKLFGVNASLLIDHAWGVEPCTLADVKAYKPESSSLSSGQVLPEPYPAAKARLVVREMTDALVLELVEKGLVTDRLTLTVGYDVENLQDPVRRAAYRGEVKRDHYGRAVPRHAHGTAALGRHSSSTREITDAVMELFGRIVDSKLLVRRLTLAAHGLLEEEEARRRSEGAVQLDLFSDPAAEAADLSRERRRQEAVLAIRRRYGKNAMLKGMDLEEGATAVERNRQIGGHKA